MLYLLYFVFAFKNITFIAFFLYSLETAIWTSWPNFSHFQPHSFRSGSATWRPCYLLCDAFRWQHQKNQSGKRTLIVGDVRCNLCLFISWSVMELFERFRLIINLEVYWHYYLEPFQDMESDLYEQYYLNFISAINRDRLEDLASAAIHAQTVTSITKVATHLVARETSMSFRSWISTWTSFR